MKISDVTEKLMAAKKHKGLSFADLEKTVGRDEVWIAALFYRQASASEEEAMKIVSALELGKDVAESLTECPTKGLGPVVPTDPLGYGCFEDPKGDRVRITMSGKFLPYKKW
jgi:cyanate lyase